MRDHRPSLDQGQRPWGPFLGESHRKDTKSVGGSRTYYYGCNSPHSNPPGGSVCIGLAPHHAWSPGRSWFVQGWRHCGGPLRPSSQRLIPFIEICREPWPFQRCRQSSSCWGLCTNPLPGCSAFSWFWTLFQAKANMAVSSVILLPNVTFKDRSAWPVFLHSVVLWGNNEWSIRKVLPTLKKIFITDYLLT